MRICDETGDELSRARATQHADPPANRTLPLHTLAQPFQTFIQYPLNRALRHPKVARTQPLVKSPHTLFAQNLLYAQPATAQHFLVALRKLQPGLDHPNWVCRCAGHDARDRSSRQVYPAVLLPVVELFGDEALAVSVGEEVNGARRDDADECGSKAFEECTEGLFTIDITME